MAFEIAFLAETHSANVTSKIFLSCVRGKTDLQIVKILHLFKNLLMLDLSSEYKKVVIFNACFACAVSSYRVGPSDSYKVGRHRAFLQCGYADERPSNLFVQKPGCKCHKQMVWLQDGPSCVASNLQYFS